MESGQAGVSLRRPSWGLAFAKAALVVAVAEGGAVVVAVAVAEKGAVVVAVVVAEGGAIRPQLHRQRGTNAHAVRPAGMLHSMSAAVAVAEVGDVAAAEGGAVVVAVAVAEVGAIRPQLAVGCC